MTHLYTCLIQDQSDGEAFVQVYWGRGEHIGDALEKMMAAAWQNGLSSPEPRELDPYDLDRLADNVEPGRDAEVFWSTTRFGYPPVETFPLPYGVIASCLEGGDDVEDIAAGFSIETNEQGLTTIEANVPRFLLLDTYARLLEHCPQYKVYWYLLHDHWDDQPDEFLVNESLSTPALILEHLQAHPNDSWRNGFVTLTAYCEEGKTNVSISDHKRLVVHTYNRAIAERHAMTLESLGIPQADALVSIDCRIHHWHYRHPLSRSRSELTEHLKGLGFRTWVPGQ